MINMVEKVILQIQYNPNQKPHLILHRNRKKQNKNKTTQPYSKIHLEAQKTLDGQNNPEQDRTTTLDWRDYHSKAQDTLECHSNGNNRLSTKPDMDGDQQRKLDNRTRVHVLQPSSVTLIPYTGKRQCLPQLELGQMDVHTRRRNQTHSYHPAQRTNSKWIKRPKGKPHS